MMKGLAAFSVLKETVPENDTFLNLSELLEDITKFDKIIYSNKHIYIHIDENFSNQEMLAARFLVHYLALVAKTHPELTCGRKVFVKQFPWSSCFWESLEDSGLIETNKSFHPPFIVKARGQENGCEFTYHSPIPQIRDSDKPALDFEKAAERDFINKEEAFARCPSPSPLPACTILAPTCSPESAVFDDGMDRYLNRQYTKETEGKSVGKFSLNLEPDAPSLAAQLQAAAKSAKLAMLRPGTLHEAMIGLGLVLSKCPVILLSGSYNHQTPLQKVSRTERGPISYNCLESRLLEVTDGSSLDERIREMIKRGEETPGPLLATQYENQQQVGLPSSRRGPGVRRVFGR